MPRKKLGPGVYEVFNNLGKVAKGLKGIGRDRVLVGIPADAAAREPDPDTGEVSELNNAEIGYIHEFGAPEANIPARPWLVPGVSEGQAKVARRLQQAAQGAVDGKDGLVDRALHAAGMEATNAVKHKLTEGPFQALSEATLYNRRLKGRTGTKPLIDTGDLRRKVNYVVERNGAKRG